MYTTIFGQTSYNLYGQSEDLLLNSTIQSTTSSIMSLASTAFPEYSSRYSQTYARLWNGELFNNCLIHGTNCPDGYNKSLYTYYLGTDCANFVSQCLRAGGMYIDSTWNEFTGPWRNCDTLLAYWRSKGAKRYTSSIIDLEDDREEFNSYIYNNGYIGDIFFLIDSEGDAWHAMIITGYGVKDLLYSAHTSNRENKSLYTMLKEQTDTNHSSKLTVLSFK